MMCHRIGCSPIGIIGLGFRQLSSLMRVPKPPAKITIFIAAVLQTRPGPALQSDALPSDTPRSASKPPPPGHPQDTWKAASAPAPPGSAAPAQPGPSGSLPTASAGIQPWTSSPGRYPNPSAAGGRTQPGPRHPAPRRPCRSTSQSGASAAEAGYFRHTANQQRSTPAGTHPRFLRMPGTEPCPAVHPSNHRS